MEARVLPDLIVLDLKMPRRSGWEVLDLLRRSTTFVQIPIVVLSSYLTVPPPGAVAWLKKPCQSEELVRTVSRLTRASLT
jgi:CheY-like chemotaxis protein